MVRSLQQQLDDLDTQIAKAESAQSYTTRGRQLVRAQLRDLYAERRRLAQELSEGGPNSGRMASVGHIVRAR